MVHRNFAQVEEMLNNLMEVSTNLGYLEETLAEASNDPLGPATYLLTMHFQINQLTAFRSQTMHQAQAASSDARAVLTRHFTRLDELITSFDDYISMLGRNVLSIVRSGNPGVIVRLIKIVEMEGKEDEKVV